MAAYRARYKRGRSGNDGYGASGLQKWAKRINQKMGSQKMQNKALGITEHDWASFHRAIPILGTWLRDQETNAKTNAYLQARGADSGSLAYPGLAYEGGSGAAIAGGMQTAGGAVAKALNRAAKQNNPASSKANRASAKTFRGKHGQSYQNWNGRRW